MSSIKSIKENIIKKVWNDIKPQPGEKASDVAKDFLPNKKDFVADAKKGTKKLKDILINPIKAAKDSIKCENINEEFSPSELAFKHSAHAEKIQGDLERAEKDNADKSHMSDVSHMARIAHKNAAYAHHNALDYHKQQARQYEDKLDSTPHASAEEKETLNHLISMHHGSVEDHRTERDYHAGMSKYA